VSFEDDLQHLVDYWKKLEMDQLNEVLCAVLLEMRARETDQLKADMLTHSKQLRSKKPQPCDDPK
jgi:hypothetical protein